MKSIVVLFISFCIVVNINAQNLKTPVNIDPIYTIAYNKFGFFPKNKESNIYFDLIKNSNNIRYIYFINGLELSEEVFLKLKLNQRDVHDDEVYYTLNFRNDDNKCIESINLYINLGIPIWLNGEKLKSNLYDYYLSEIKSEQLVSIKCKQNLFGKRYVEIIIQ